MNSVQNPFETDDNRWQAVLQRDKEADGCFVYGVLTTGVYCRPSCPSRGAKRENVRFYTLNKEAETDGLRPCKRCKPTELSLTQERLALVEKACRYIETQEGICTLQDIAAHVGLAPHHFHRIFKSLTGITPKAYETAYRTGRLKETLADASSVTDAIYASGAGSSSSFQNSANRAIAMKPSTFRKGGQGEVIHYATSPSPLGLVIVATTARGICAIRLGDSEKALKDELQASFPAASLVHDENELQQTVHTVLSYLEHPAGSFDLPLDIQGTAFQQRVWQELQNIPLGETRSYSEMAEAIGKPAAVRAVASAIAANSHAIIIPCHRVVRSDGSISGYRWGPDRKKRILAHEKTGTKS